MHTKKFSLAFIALYSLAILSACSSDTVTPVTNTSKSTINITQSSIPVSTDTSTVTPDTTTETVSASSVNNVATASGQGQITNKTVTYLTDHSKHRVSASFAVTIDASGIITAVSVSMNSGDRESSQYINRFNSAAKGKIVGQKISELSLSAVGGASDTTDAFLQVVNAL